MVVGDNLDLTVLPDTDTTLWEEMSAYEDGTPATGDLPVGGAQIDTDGSAGNHLGAGFCGRW